MITDKVYGLIGKELAHSFSKKYFDKKFSSVGSSLSDKSGFSESFSLFQINDIEALPDVLKQNPQLVGLAVTIPYKQAVIPYLSNLDDTAAKTGAVNCIVISGNQLKGYNTDVKGFEMSISPLLKPWHKKAAIFGSGGASLAVQYVLREMGIQYTIVNRSGVNALPYSAVSAEFISEHTLLINCTPLGMYPQVSTCVPIPFDAVTPQHLLFDLVYNPEETVFLQRGMQQGAAVKNGLDMLYAQAEENYRIWNSV